MTQIVDAAAARADQAAPDAEPRVRTAIAVVMTRFPRIDETFILREVDELERRGQPVLIVPILRGDTSVVHEEAKPWMRRALYTPFISGRVVAANFRALWRQPRNYLGLLWRLVTGTMLRPTTLIHTLVLFPKSVYLAAELPARGIRHVHAHFATHATTMAYIIAALSDISYSFTVHGPDVFVHRLLLREKIRRAKFVRSISVFNKAFLSGLYPVVSEGKIEVVHSGVNPDIYAEAAEKKQSGSRPRLLSVAALTPSRGFPFLVDACAKLVERGIDVECRIVGAGPLRDTTEQWIHRRGLDRSVKLLGSLPQHEVAREMGEADVFVLPSIIAVDGQMDGIPVSLMEALAAGKPVVASPISGIPELVKDGTSGFIVDATHSEDVASKVGRLLSDPALRTRLGRAGQQRVRDAFDIRKTTATLVALFDRHRDVNTAPASVAEQVRNLTWSRLGAVAVGVRRIHERADSLIAEVTISDGIHRRDVVVRRQRETVDGSATDRARKLFEVLSTLAQSMPRESAPGRFIYTVPRVLMFDEPRAALVIERADGKSVGGLVRSARSSGLTGKLTSPLRHAGAWLRAMQRGTEASAEDGRHVLTAVVLIALEDLELATAAERSLRKRHAAIADRLRELESRVSERPLRVVGHHGGYRPDSIFMGDGTVSVLDFGGYREGLDLEDVAHFLLHIDLNFSSPLNRRHRERLKNAFLEGYAEGSPVDSEVLALLTLTRALAMLAHGGTGSGRLEEWRHRVLLRQTVLEKAR